MDGFTVTLKRHKGEKAIGFGVTKEVDLRQDMVFVNDEFVGYAPDKGQISILRKHMDPEVKAFVVEEIKRLKGDVNSGVVEIAKLEDSDVVLESDTPDAEPLI